MRIAPIVAVLTAALACALLAGPASATVLFDQTDAPADYGSGSQDGPGGYDDETADDFTVPAGVQWAIAEVDVAGGGYGTPSVPQSVDITFYADALGSPGAVVLHRTLPTYGGARPDFVLPIAPAALLPPGTYWLSVRVGIGDGTPSSEWFWTARSTVSGAPAAYRTQSASDVFSAWAPRSTAPDQIFKLSGIAGTSDAPAPGGSDAPGTPAPPATGTPAAPVTGAAAPAFSKLVTLPPAKSCVSRRRLRLHLHAPKGTSIVKATIKVAGRPAKVVKGKALAVPVNLTGLPRGRYAVKVTVKLANGRTVSGTRTYRTCATKAKH